MNEIKQMFDILSKEIPDAHLILDPPINKLGTWQLDIHLDDQYISVIWRLDKGFGIAYGDRLYGEGCDEVYKDLPAAMVRISELVIRKDL